MIMGGSLLLNFNSHLQRNNSIARYFDDDDVTTHLFDHPNQCVMH